jgi:hypothetical protein
LVITRRWNSRRCSSAWEMNPMALASCRESRRPAARTRRRCYGHCWLAAACLPQRAACGCWQSRGPNYATR